MSNRILVLYGSYRSDRMGIRLAQFIVEGFRARGDDVELIDAKAIGLPMLDRMYKEHPKGAAPAPLEKLAGQIRDADGFVFVTGEYNWGMQPGMVLAPGCDCQLFGRAVLRRARRARVARHALRDGHGGDFEFDRGRANFADAVRRREADRRRWQGAGARIPALCG